MCRAIEAEVEVFELVAGAHGGGGVVCSAEGVLFFFFFSSKVGEWVSGLDGSWGGGCGWWGSGGVGGRGRGGREGGGGGGGVVCSVEWIRFVTRWVSELSGLDAFVLGRSWL